jgi:outer membrane receptor protein involved in Fe transport
VEQVIITAGRTASSVQATPMSVSALSGTQLREAGTTSIEDLTRMVPGVSMRTAGAGQTEYEIRGIASNGGSSPTVAFYLDETPLSPPALSQSGKTVIDPDLFDLDRVEILRGPQGTLYGGSAMGGAIRVIPKPPQPGVASAELRGGVSSTEGGGLNGVADVVLNTDVKPDLTVRLVADYAHRSGWIDQVILKSPPLDALGGGSATQFVRTMLNATPQATPPA